MNSTLVFSSKQDAIDSAREAFAEYLLLGAWQASLDDFRHLYRIHYQMRTNESVSVGRVLAFRQEWVEGVFELAVQDEDRLLECWRNDDWSM